MFKLPNPPSPQADVHELADFAELLSWDRGTVSERELVAYLGRVDDNDSNIGCDDNDDENAETLDEVMNEIERRDGACGRGYPFQLSREGTVLHYDNALEDDQRSLVYRYLLLSTRLNMRDNRVHENIDGASLLESLSAHVLRIYLGAARAKAIVFGTSIGGGFAERVENLCRDLCEGAGFRSLDNASVQANDDKLDTVAWIPFSDCLPGQLIIFGQCKTGTNWDELVTQLQPIDFVKRWMREPILVDPIRAFCISEAADRTRWRSTCVSAGILLDRCRIVDNSDGIESATEERIRKWTTAAKLSVKF
ncbi:MAG: hypothetical protein EPN22_15155 [Nitrospirae bacterium]|nr:MAG: hypothetical protein EPN22_15155 [Nitrospirota bacterium]